MDGRSTPSRRRSADPSLLGRLLRSLAAEGILLRSLFPDESPPLFAASVRRWPAWTGPVCPRCGAFSPVPGPAGPDGIPRCIDCPAGSAVSAARSLVPYREEIRDALKNGKYGRLPLSADALADRLLAAIRADWRDLFPNRFRPAVVPVPITPRKYFRRGFNLPARIGRRLARRAGWEFAPLLLARVRDGIPQAGLPIERRADNVRGSFAVPPGTDVPRRILLLDDVYTSGSTAQECALALKRSGAEHIVVLTVARAVP